MEKGDRLFLFFILIPEAEANIGHQVLLEGHSDVIRKSEVPGNEQNINKLIHQKMLRRAL